MNNQQNPVEIGIENKALKLTNFAFPKFENLSLHYANKVDFRKIQHIEKDDLIQDLKLKIFESLKKWFIKSEKYKLGLERFKPVDMKFYIGASCNNLLADLFKDLDAKPKQALSIQSDSFDFGVFTAESENSIFDWDSRVLILNGVNLLEGLQGVEQTVFFLYLKGYSILDLRKIFSTLKVDTIINEQKKFLATKKSSLLQDVNSKTFFTFKTEE